MNEDYIRAFTHGWEACIDWLAANYDWPNGGDGWDGTTPVEEAKVRLEEFVEAFRS